MRKQTNSRTLLGTASALTLIIAALVASHEIFAQPQTASPAKDAHGDALPEGALARMGTVRWRHGDNVTFVAFTKDAKGVVTASQDGVVRLWDRDTGKEIRRFGKQVAPGAPIGIRPPAAG